MRIYEVNDIAVRARGGGAPVGVAAPVREQRVALDSQLWLLGHCPTYKFPAFPMFGVLGGLLATSPSIKKLAARRTARNHELDKARPRPGRLEL